MIINTKLEKNLRKNNWTLRLQAQEGDYRIIMIADVPGLGKVLFYPEGMANILSQFHMDGYSKWSIEHITKRFHVTEWHQCLFYHVTTN